MERIKRVYFNKFKVGSWWVTGLEEIDMIIILKISLYCIWKERVKTFCLFYLSLILNCLSRLHTWIILRLAEIFALGYKVFSLQTFLAAVYL